MKKIISKFVLSIVICLLLQISLEAQVPYSFNYQGVARSATGTPVSSQEIGLRLSIRSGSPEGNVVFTEEHHVTTSEFGLFNVLVGQGDDPLGTLLDVAWSEGIYFLQTELDIDGGTNFLNMGTTQMYAVPYSIASAYAENDKDIDPENEIQNLSLDGNKLSLSGANEIMLPEGSVDTDDQQLSLNGTALSISEGNSIDLGTLPGLNKESYWSKLDDSRLGLVGLIPEPNVWFEQTEGFGELGISVDQLGSINLNGVGFFKYNEAGNPLIEIRTGFTPDVGIINLFGENGSANIALHYLPDNSNNGFLSIFDDSGNLKSAIFVDDDLNGKVQTRGANGNLNISITALNDEPDFGFISAKDDQGETKSAMYVDSDGVGRSYTRGPNGKSNISLTFLSANNNHGYLSLRDAAGDTKAGVYVDSDGNGRIFADMKNFKVAHPSNPELDIVYTSLEGPEAAAFLRGTDQLINGKAKIRFPDHFQHIISSVGITIVLTPLSGRSNGLAVIEKSKEGFEVIELFDGQESYAFDWEAKAVRSGYEDYQVLQKKAKAALDINQTEKRLPNTRSN